MEEEESGNERATGKLDIVLLFTTSFKLLNLLVFFMRRRLFSLLIRKNVNNQRLTEIRLTRNVEHKKWSKTLLRIDFPFFFPSVLFLAKSNPFYTILIVMPS